MNKFLNLHTGIIFLIGMIGLFAFTSYSLMSKNQKNTAVQSQTGTIAKLRLNVAAACERPIPNIWKRKYGAQKTLLETDHTSFQYSGRDLYAKSDFTISAPIISSN